MTDIISYVVIVLIVATDIIAFSTIAENNENLQWYAGFHYFYTLYKFVSNFINIIL